MGHAPVADPAVVARLHPTLSGLNQMRASARHIPA